MAFHAAASAGTCISFVEQGEENRCWTRSPGLRQSGKVCGERKLRDVLEGLAGSDELRADWGVELW